MKVEEIALRHEIRQMMSEAGINKNTIREIAEQVLKEEIDKQIKNILCQTNMNALMSSKIKTYEFRNMLQQAIKDEIRNAVDISVDVKTTIK